MDTDYFPRGSVSDEHPLPTPSDTPYQTPQLSSARLSSFGTALSTPLTTPPLRPRRYEDRPHHEDKEQLPQYDQADFTPTLHASLVSEILTLRRDVDSKVGLVDELESTLASTRTENETLQNNLKRTGKETRALKRQLQLHEDGTLSAMESLAKERDDINEANLELRKKLELSQKRFRSHEEDAGRLKESLDTERKQRADEKRGLEWKLQLAEHRLAAVVSEVTATTSLPEVEQSLDHVEPATAGESEIISESEAMTTPTSHARKLRFDQTNSVGSVREMKASLADELSFIESEDEDSSAESPVRAAAQQPKRISDTPTDVSDLDLGDYGSRLHQARSKRFSKTEDGKARKVLGMVSVFEDQMKSTAEAERERNAMLLRTQTEAKRKSVSSPPTRPTSKAGKQLSWYSHDDERPMLDQVELEDQENLPPAQVSETEANQRRKRAPSTLRNFGHARTQSEPSPSAKLSAKSDEASGVSPAAFTASFATATETGDEPFRLKTEMISTSTQTEPSSESTPASGTAASASEITIRSPEPERAISSIPPTIPAIKVLPPDSSPSSPVGSLKRKARAQPETRHIGSQTKSIQVLQSRSIAVQTEAIRIDQRPVKLPMHLLPSTLSEQLKAQEQAKTSAAPSEASQGAGHTRDKPPRSNGKILATNDLDSTFLPPLPPLEELDDDFNPASITSASNAQRLSRSIYSSPPLSSTGSHLDDPDDIDLSDIEYGTNLSMSKPSHRSSRHGRAPLDLPMSVPEDESFVLASAPHARHKHANSNRSARSSLDKGKKKMTTSTDASSQYQTRLAFLTRNGSSAGGSRSPSLNSNFSSGNFSKTGAARPPFVIPARRSSKEPITKARSNRSSGLSSPTRGGRTSPHKNGRSSPSKVVRREQSERPPSKQPKFLRKARSAAAINTSKPADTFGIPSNLGPITQTPQKPPANVAYGQKAKDAGGDPDHPHVSTMFPTGSASVGSVKLQHNVVDAITATMIGEWMWKYTRKRISFGTGEQDASDVRHKRWVWLSPYERTVMWSTKQPISNTALMGKTGRKLSIQSVIDVKDDMALPKDARGQPIFDRSILVLTPARALKFTASARERHFMWLTALSFLAHQTDHSIPKYQFNPPLPPSIPESSVSSTRSRASSFRNPLRPSKSKNTSQQTSGAGTPVAQNFDPNIVQRPPIPKAAIPESAFAPAVPRVPHSRKRSLTGPSRGKSSSFASLGMSVRGRPMISSRNSSAAASNSRVQSQSGDSARRTPNAQEAEEPMPTRTHHTRAPRMEPRAERIPELSPRQSIMGGADFGGNNSFFDAVGVMRMDAMISAPEDASANKVKGKGKTGKNGDIDQVSQEAVAAGAGLGGLGHHRHDSSGSSFQGPPDISKSRPLRRVGGGGALRVEKEKERERQREMDEPFAGF